MKMIQVKMIQVILFMTSFNHLVYCRAIQRDVNSVAKVSKRSLDCSSNEVLEDISSFNYIFIKLLNKNGDDHNIIISDETVR